MQFIVKLWKAIITIHFNWWLYLVGGGSQSNIISLWSNRDSISHLIARTQNARTLNFSPQASFGRVARANHNGREKAWWLQAYGSVICQYSCADYTALSMDMNRVVSTWCCTYIHTEQYTGWSPPGWTSDLFYPQWRQIIPRQTDAFKVDAPIDFFSRHTATLLVALWAIVFCCFTNTYLLLWRCVSGRSPLTRAIICTKSEQSETMKISASNHQRKRSHVRGILFSTDSPLARTLCAMVLQQTILYRNHFDCTIARGYDVSCQWYSVHSWDFALTQSLRMHHTALSTL